MIPGNRPEDEDDERFFKKLDEKFLKEHPQHMHTLNELTDQVQYEDAIYEYVCMARDIGYHVGYQEAKNDADIIQAMEEDA